MTSVGIHEFTQWTRLSEARVSYDESRSLEAMLLLPSSLLLSPIWNADFVAGLTAHLGSGDLHSWLKPQ
jgi:hypothetical protein